MPNSPTPVPMHGRERLYRGTRSNVPRGTTIGCAIRLGRAGQATIMIDAVMVIARADRRRADCWIGDHCDPYQSSPPIVRQVIASVTCSDPAMTMMLHCLLPDRGWSRNGDTLLCVAYEAEMIHELLWVRAHAASSGAPGTLSVKTAAVIGCTIDTTQNFDQFVATFGAHVLNHRSAVIPE